MGCIQKNFSTKTLFAHGHPLLYPCKIALHLTIIYILFHFVESSQRIREIERKILDKILSSRYDNRIRPSGESLGDTDGPCQVEVNIMVRSISRIDDVKMEYSAQLTFREEWMDNRLDYRNELNNISIKHLVLTEQERIWKPDLFFKNEKKGHFHNIIMPNVLLRIKPDGKILYSIRISLNLFCPMDLKFFPLDIQTCAITMASYGYTVKDLVFYWRAFDPVQTPNDTKMFLPRFTLIKHLTKRCESGNAKTATGEYSCIEVLFYFKREFSYYLFLIYVPCCMLVIVSWVSFWIDPNSTAARVLLGVTSLLTMARQISSINASLPKVSYSKAVDVWTECCLIFVFSALIEFAVVNYVSRQDAQRAGQRRRRPTMIGARKKYDSGKDSGIDSSDIEDGHAGYAKTLGSHATKLPKKKPKRRPFYLLWISTFTTRAKKIDVGSRIIFPIFFAVFNLFYWTKYLFARDLKELDM